MTARRKFLSFLILLSMPASVFSQALWAEDRLVGHFDEGVSSAGPGFSNIDCIYGSSQDIFVAMVENSTSESGDELYIRKSVDNGINWPYQKSVTGGDNDITCPAIVRIPDSDEILAAVITTFPGGSSVIDTYRYDYNSLSYEGYSAADFSYSGAGNPVSCVAVSNTAGGEIWVFAVDDNNWLFLTRSSDGMTWTPSEPIAANAVRPHAEVSADGHVIVTWISTGAANINCAVADKYGVFSSGVLVATGASQSASPFAGWEQTGDQTLGILWHTNAGECYMSMSSDMGSSWTSPEYICDGLFPYVDRFPGTRRMGVCCTTESGSVMVASAVSMSAVPVTQFTARNSHPAYTGGSARAAFGETSSQLALFFISEDEKDIWFNSSVWTGIEEGQSTTGLQVNVSPNPVGSAAVLSSSGASGPGVFRVYSADGRIAEEVFSAEEQYALDTSDLPSGVYLVTCERNGERASCRMIRFQH